MTASSNKTCYTPGRLAPRWLDDLCASDMPEWETLGAIDQEFRQWRQVDERHRHNLFLIPAQCPPKPTEENVQISSAICSTCLHHFVFRCSFDPSAGNCSEKTDPKFPM